MDLQFVVLSGESLRPNASTRTAIKAHVMRRYRYNQRQMRLQQTKQTRGSEFDCYAQLTLPSAHTARESHSTTKEPPSSSSSSNGLLDLVAWPQEGEFLVDEFYSFDQLNPPYLPKSISSCQFDPFSTLPVALTPRLSALLYQGESHIESIGI